LIPIFAVLLAELFASSIMVIMHTAGPGIRNDGIDGVEKEAHREDEDMVQETQEVQSDAYSYLYVFDVGREADSFFVYDVAAAGAQL
jgi:hypothetical protein